jgi:hypothetical protein
LLPRHRYDTNPVQGFLQRDRWKETCVNIWVNASFKLGSLLLDPDAGDVVFVVRDADNSSKKLYANKSILAGNSEYFKSGMVN